MFPEFIEWLKKGNKSINTVASYASHIEDYIKWFEDRFNMHFSKLYRQNILEYISFMLNIKRLNAKSINAKIAAIVKLNEYLIEINTQDDLVVFKQDYNKVQVEYVSPSTLSKSDVEYFRQRILETGNRRNYAIVTLLAYSGMRISEALNVKLADMNLISKEIVVRFGRGKKQRIVIINDKIVNALREYLKERHTLKNTDNEYLFLSRESGNVNRTRINHIFNKYSDKITPHTLRHFFCSYALENGWAAHEVAAQVGHSNIQTTMIYTHPSREEMKRKSNLL
jgi:integrase/recombinase XerD